MLATAGTTFWQRNHQVRLSSLQLQGFPSSLQLPLRGLTVLIGSNGVGKTSILEVCKLLPLVGSPLFPVFPPKMRNMKVLLEFGPNDELRRYSFKVQGDRVDEVFYYKNGKHYTAAGVSPSAMVGSVPEPELRLILRGFLSRVRTLPEPNQLPDWLERIFAASRSAERDFLDLLQLGFDALFPMDGRQLAALFSLQENTSAAFSSGIQTWIRWCALYSLPRSASLIVADNIERDLEPGLVVRVVQMLESLAENCPVLVTTHSDLVLDTLTDPVSSLRYCEHRQGGLRLRGLDSEAYKLWSSDKGVGTLRKEGHLHDILSDAEDGRDP